MRSSVAELVELGALRFEMSDTTQISEVSDLGYSKSSPSVAELVELRCLAVLSFTAIADAADGQKKLPNHDPPSSASSATVRKV